MPVNKYLDALTRRVAIAGFVALTVMAILTMFDSLLRHLELARIPGFGDVGEVIFAIIIASCFPVGLLREQNIRISLLGDRFVPRLRPWLEAFGSLLTFLVFTAIAWQFVAMTWDMQISHRVTSTISLPAAPWWWVSTAIMLVTVPVQAFVLFTKLSAIRQPQGAG
ncbi:MAG: TRAP transporter small permease subunit [Gammaproteobacteria bacterium]